MATQVYQFVITYNSGGQFAQNVTHWKFDDGGFASTALAAQALCEALIPQIQDPLANLLPQQVAQVSYKARRVTNGGGFEFISIAAPPYEGDDTGDLQASGVGGVIIGYTANEEDRSRMKMFLPGVSSESLVNGKFTDVYRGIAVTSLTTMFDPVALVGGGSPTASMCLYNANPANAPIVVKWRLSPTVGTMRRRQRPV